MPAGLTVDADTGAIRGTPYVVLAETEFSIVATSGEDKRTGVVKITVNDNVCAADGAWWASFIGQQLETKCKFLGKETRSCVLKNGGVERRDQPVYHDDFDSCGCGCCGGSCDRVGADHRFQKVGAGMRGEGVEREAA